MNEWFWTGIVMVVVVFFRVCQQWFVLVSSILFGTVALFRVLYWHRIVVLLTGGEKECLLFVLYTNGCCLGLPSEMERHE